MAAGSQPPLQHGLLLPPGKCPLLPELPSQSIHLAEQLGCWGRPCPISRSRLAHSGTRVPRPSLFSSLPHPDFLSLIVNSNQRASGSTVALLGEEGAEPSLVVTGPSCVRTAASGWETDGWPRQTHAPTSLGAQASHLSCPNSELQAEGISELLCWELGHISSEVTWVMRTTGPFWGLHGRDCPRLRKVSSYIWVICTST